MINIKNAPVQGLERKQKTDAIIFDLGGVLLNLDFDRSFQAFIDLGFTNFKQEISKLLYSQKTGINESIFHLYEKGMISSKEFRESIRKYLRPDVSDHEIDIAWTSMLLDLHQENISILRNLKGHYRLFLLSNTNDIHIKTLHARNNGAVGFSQLVDQFEKVYYSHDVKMRKPDPEIFTHVLDDSRLLAETSLFVDDSEHNITAAKSLGLQTYHHKMGTSLDQLFDIR